MNSYFVFILSIIIVIALTIIFLYAMHKGAFPWIHIRGRKGDELEIDTNPAKNKIKDKSERVK